MICTNRKKQSKLYKIDFQGFKTLLLEYRGVYFLPEILLDFLEKQFSDRREDLILIPDDIHFRFKSRGNRTKAQSALTACVYQVFKG